MNVPKRIFLQVSDDYGLDKEIDWIRDEITWCIDEINPTDIEYVSLKDYDELKKEIAFLRKDNKRLMKSLMEIYDRTKEITKNYLCGSTENSNDNVAS